MPRFLTVFFIGMITSTLLVGCGTATASSQQQFLFIGDSLTGGWYASTQARDYVSLVTAYEHAKAIDTHGTFGVSTVATLASMQHHTPPPADVVILELGTNDVGESVNTFSTAYAQMVTLLKRAEPHARWVCLGVWRDPQSDGGNPGWEYDQVIQADCPGEYVWLGGLYMNFNLHGPVGRASWRGVGDWFHPNDAGHAAIAKLVEQALK